MASFDWLFEKDKRKWYQKIFDWVPFAIFLLIFILVGTVIGVLLQKYVLHW